MFILCLIGNFWALFIAPLTEPRTLKRAGRRRKHKEEHFCIAAFAPIGLAGRKGRLKSLILDAGPASYCASAFQTMIPKHRNRGIIQLAAGLGMAVLCGFMLRDALPDLRAGTMSDGWKALLVLVYLATVTMWMAGSFSLAKAKGYGTDIMGPVFVFLFLLGICVPLSPFLFPWVVIFGLKDKMRVRRRKRVEERPADHASKLRRQVSSTFCICGWHFFLPPHPAP
ncbi:MAG TPA: hypothetical protein VGO59_19845 [Verrucomicrobiae bacterium]